MEIHQLEITQLLAVSFEIYKFSFSEFFNSKLLIFTYLFILDITTQVNNELAEA